MRNISLIIRSSVSPLFPEEKVLHFLEFLLTQMNAGCWDITLFIMDDDEMKKANELVFGISDTTDVISVLLDKDEGIEAELLLGIEEIERNAKDYNVDFEWEFMFCLAHGVLHLLGWEDDTVEKRNQMYSLQEELIRKYLEKDR